MLKIADIKRKAERYICNRSPFRNPGNRFFDYRKTIDTANYCIYERAFHGRKIVAAYGDMAILQSFKNPNKITIYPFISNKMIRKNIKLCSTNFAGLLPNSHIVACYIFPYMRVVSPNKYIKSLRINIITDKAQIFHNYPARANDCDGISKPSDIYKFEESVIWDLPYRKFPSREINCEPFEQYFPNLPDECYKYHPMANSDVRYLDRFGNGGFPNNTIVCKDGKKVNVSRFYVYNRDNPQANSFHCIGTGDKNYKLNLLATYRSNTNVGVRTCVFATSDGGRQWYCKYEFADMGEYKFRQGDSKLFGLNFGNPIENTNYCNHDFRDVHILKRSLIIPNVNDKEPKDKFSWLDIGDVCEVINNKLLTLKITRKHNLSTGNVVCLTSPQNSVGMSIKWMINNDISSTSAGNGLLFKVKVIDDFVIQLFELVSSADNNIPCRHIHHINRIKDGWILGSGEIYPNGWLLYFQVKAADTFTFFKAADDLNIIRLNSTMNSAQRTMGAILRDDEDQTLIYASDHDLLNGKECTIDAARTIEFERNSTGIYSTSLRDIDDRRKHHLLFEMDEPCFYFQRLDDMYLFCGQRGELGISFDFLNTIKKEQLESPIIYFYGSNRHLYYFNDCIIYKK